MSLGELAGSQMVPALPLAAATLLLGFGLLSMTACAPKEADAGDKGLPPPAKVVSMVDLNVFSVQHPDQFPLVRAEEHPTTSELVVTGTVNPDISLSVPVISLASGRVVAIHARLGDTVKKGQLLLTVQSDDVSGAFSNYRKAIADEVLSKAQLDRAKDLHEHGAIALNDLEVAQDTEAKAIVDLETMAEHLRLLGNDPGKSSGMVNIYAPVAGVITDQQVTNAAGVQSLGTSPFTISNLARVWAICDVYENDLAAVKLGDTAEIRLNAYPAQVFRGSISNIGPILDPNIRTAKVRIELENPGIMRLGMFVKATFRGRTKEVHTVVPATAVMHMQDRDFVFVPLPDNKFSRVEVQSGDVLADSKMQEVKSGIRPGQQVVANALVLDHVLAQ